MKTHIWNNDHFHSFFFSLGELDPDYFIFIHPSYDPDMVLLHACFYWKNKDVEEGSMPTVASPVSIGAKAQMRLLKVNHTPIALLYSLTCIGLPSEKRVCLIQHTQNVPKFCSSASITSVAFLFFFSFLFFNLLTSLQSWVRKAPIGPVSCRLPPCGYLV